MNILKNKENINNKNVNVYKSKKICTFRTLFLENKCRKN